MQCDICHRAAREGVPFNCTQCAREAAYPLRIQNVQALLAKEDAEKQVDEAVNAGKTGVKAGITFGQHKNSASPAWTLQELQREKAIVEDRTQTILAQTQELNTEISNMNAEIIGRRKKLQDRRAQLKTAHERLAREQAAAIEPLEKGIRRTHSRWDLLQKRLATDKLVLAKAAASLARLRCHKGRRTSSDRDLYSIGNVPIVDLRDLNSKCAVSCLLS